MIDISLWMEQFNKKLENTFCNRIWFAGLQGSYGRGEAAEHSDIDVVVILDSINTEDLKTYHTLLDEMPHRERICGFLSGRDELLNWDTADLFQFYYDTTPYIGTLDPLLPLIDREAVERAIKMGAGNLYHGCVHNMLHEKSMDILRGLYKSAAFTVRAVYFLQAGNYLKQKSELIQAVDPAEREILILGQKIKDGGEYEFLSASETLFMWAKGLLVRC